MGRLTQGRPSADERRDVLSYFVTKSTPASVCGFIRQIRLESSRLTGRELSNEQRQHKLQMQLQGEPVKAISTHYGSTAIWNKFCGRTLRANELRVT